MKDSRGQTLQFNGRKRIFSEAKNERLFQYDIIEERSGTFRPNTDRVVDYEAANRQGEEKNDEQNYDPFRKSYLHDSFTPWF